MLPITEILKNAQKLVSNNAPAILSASAAAGVVGSTVLTARASFKASEVIRKHEEENGRLFSEKPGEEFLDRAKQVWMLYIPAASTAAASIACIIASNSISTRRQAAVMTAYSLTETAFKEYQEKVVEQVGINKETKIHDEAVKAQVAKLPESAGREIIITGTGTQLCRETSGRYFESTIETLRKAENDLNRQLIHDMSAPLNDFYRLIGLETTTMGDEVGWNIDRPLELRFTADITAEGRPFIIVDYRTAPIRGYYKIG